MASTDLDLFRSVRKEDFPNGTMIDDHVVTGVLYPSFEDKIIEIKKGGKIEKKLRPADIVPYSYKDVQVVDPGEGTSLFDRANVFGAKYWHCFTLPKGTVIPDSLCIVFTGPNSKFNADHYQIEAASGRMQVQAYKGALDNLARNAVELTHRTAHGK
jgi:hypothetical protein